MSLEQTIADLVAASNNLTGAVNSKMEQIEQRATEFEESLPENINGMFNMRIFVNPVSGVDTATGSQDDPVENVGAAIDMVNRYGGGEIYLARGQVHALKSLHNAYDKFLAFNAYGQGANPILTSKVNIDAQGANYLAGRLETRNTWITFASVDVVLPAKADSTTGYGQSHETSMIRRDQYMSANIIFREGRFVIGDFPFLRLPSGVHLSRFVLFKPDLSYSPDRTESDNSSMGALVFLEDGCTQFAITQATREAGMEWGNILRGRKIIDASGSIINWLANIDVTEGEV